ncbi:MAG TPA: hypothetical protein EYN51_10220, partial [Flavobacteriales bacterium]|nr:hypothetical protein [Flavobacteriales bacterium]
MKTVIRQKFFYPIFIPILVILYYSVFLNIGEYSNTSYFGGDEYGYQSMGVNFTYGHGIQKLGGLEEFETYKFAPREDISGELLLQAYLVRQQANSRIVHLLKTNLKSK